jgi:MerR family transcriptional regulator, heat shock protein HspR
MADQVSQEITWSTEYSLLTLEQLSESTELHPALVEKFMQHGLIEPAADQAPGLLFPISCIERLRRIIRLRRDLRVNLAGVAVILEMREHIEELQKELERLRQSAGML